MNDRHRPHPEGFLKRNGRAVVGAAALSVVIAGAGWWFNTSVLHSADGLVAKTKTVTPPAAGDLDQSPQLSDPTDRPHADTVKAARSINLIPVNGGESPAPVDVTEDSVTPTKGVPRIGVAAIEPVSVGATGGLGTAVTAADIAMRPSLKYANYLVGIDQAAAPPPTKTALSIPVVTLDGYRKLPAKSAGVAPAKSPPVPVDGKGIDIALVREALRLEEARRFTMSMCRDLTGCLWVGTEDGGVQRFDPSAPELKQWTQFTTKDGLGDDNGYAIACDRLGRIWVGHLNHGVSVYNGQKWQNYEVVGGISTPASLSGPLGERIFAIKVCPTDGDVWIASGAGLARYSEKLQTWTYYTRADGLPSDQAGAIAFDKAGNIYVGTQCDGVAMADAADGYKTWRVATGPDQMPTDPAGTGLPTNLINDVLVASDGTVYAATTTGLAWSGDRGRNWQYVRGKDWADKVRGLYKGPPAGWTERPGALLSEDQLICLAEGERDSISIGHRQRGLELINPSRSISPNIVKSDLTSTCMLVDNACIVSGTYGTGLSMTGLLMPTAKDVPAIFGVWPSAAKSPTAFDRVSDTGEYVRNKSSLANYMGEDWTTEGDWVGRYGRQHNLLCAAMSQFNHELIVENIHKIEGELGPQHSSGDRLRGHLTLAKTEVKNSLYDPIAGVRRQSEWDDHGEDYPRSLDGPDIWLHVTLPPGEQRLTLYFYNKDGHDGDNCFRDYQILIKEEPTGGNAENDNLTTLTSARVSRFSAGGVFKSFSLTGGKRFLVIIKKCNSINVILEGVFIDKLAGPKTRFDSIPFPWLGGVTYKCPRVDYSGILNQLTNEDGVKLTQRVNALQSVENEGGIDRSLRNPELIFLYRDLFETGTTGDLLAAWRWKLLLWTPDDRNAFDATMDRAWKRQLKLTPNMAWKGRPE